MATTTNYSWTTPDDTALVKDGASAIRTLGSSVDTTVKALNPETTLGDLAYRSSTANVKTRLALGTAGQVLKVNSGATAPEWGTVAASALTKITSASYSAASEVHIDSIFTATYKRYMIVLAFTGSGSNSLKCRMRISTTTQTGSNWYGSGQEIRRNNATGTNGEAAAASKTLMPDIGGASIIVLYFSNVGNSSQSPNFFGNYIGGPNQASGNVSGLYDNDNTYTGINLTTSSGTFTGDYQVYGLEN